MTCCEFHESAREAECQPNTIQELYETPCNLCGGRGELGTEPCADCHGSSVQQPYISPKGIRRLLELARGMQAGALRNGEHQELCELAVQAALMLLRPVTPAPDCPACKRIIEFICELAVEVTFMLLRPAVTATGRSINAGDRK